MNKFILASSSIYRKALLERLQLSFDCYPPNIDESPLKGESGRQLAQRLALEKARVVALKYPDAVIIGSDQVPELTLDGPDGSQQTSILGKPGNHAQALKQLTVQSGQRVRFHSGLAVIYQGVEKITVDSTEVVFRKLSKSEIERYLQIDQPYDCAGSFKAESLGISLFSAVNSNDPSSLIGLPLITLCRLLREFGLDI